VAIPCLFFSRTVLKKLFKLNQQCKTELNCQIQTIDWGDKISVKVLGDTEAPHLLCLELLSLRLHSSAGENWIRVSSILVSNVAEG